MTTTQTESPSEHGCVSQDDFDDTMQDLYGEVRSAHRAIAFINNRISHLEAVMADIDHLRI